MIRKAKPRVPMWKKWKEVQRKILERDDYRCRGCGAKQSKKLRLTIHHTEYFPVNVEEHLRLRFEVSKLISLCEECWKKQHQKEKQAGNAPI